MVHALTTLTPLRNGQLKAAGCRELKISCGLTEFPPEIFELADTLEVLDLSGNALRALPEDLHRLHKLQILFCSNNRFTELPSVLGQCEQLEMVGFKSNQIRTVPNAALPPKLRWLILSDNALSALPPGIGQCHRLQKLMLAGNGLTELPLALSQCQALELLRVSANQLSSLPNWLLEMPRLSWLAYAGNPFTAHLEETKGGHATPTTEVPWSSLQMGPVLGEGASGEIYQATMRRSKADEQVAVKVFKGVVTSDGWPRSEMAAWVLAGHHPHLISVLGRVTDHPHQAQALVMPLIDASFTNLAQPPSRASCTRDVYANNTRFNVQEVCDLARGIADAVAHLHANGILHGDLYGHNILHNGKGLAKLGDFGAASFLPTAWPHTMQALERLEVRAFGCLLEELLAHGVFSSADGSVKSQLHQLMTECLHTTPTQRPLFQDILRRLPTGSLV